MMDEQAIAKLRERLQAAEDVCLMYGWSAGRFESDYDKATHEVWSHWADLVGGEFLSPQSHPDLNDRRIAELAAERDRKRDAALRRMGVPR
jgi:hypothetical protein